MRSTQQRLPLTPLHSLGIPASGKNRVGQEFPCWAPASLFFLEPLPLPAFCLPLARLPLPLGRTVLGP